MPIGVAALVRAGVPRDRVLNTLPTGELREWIAARRARAASRVAAARVIVS
jgi:hypothetical protein